MSKAGPADAGFSYPVVILALAALALSAEVVRVPGEHRAAREREAEMIHRGREVLAALESHWIAGGEEPERPATLDDLLEDPRTGARHLRRQRPPVPQGAWRMLSGDGGGIAGVVTELTESPIRQFGLPAGVSVQFGDGNATWTFEFSPPDAVAAN